MSLRSLNNGFVVPSLLRENQIAVSLLAHRRAVCNRTGLASSPSAHRQLEHAPFTGGAAACGMDRLGDLSRRVPLRLLAVVRVSHDWTRRSTCGAMWCSSWLDPQCLEPMPSSPVWCSAINCCLMMCCRNGWRRQAMRCSLRALVRCSRCPRLRRSRCASLRRDGTADGHEDEGAI